MEDHLLLKRNSREPQASQKIISPQVSQSVKPWDSFKSEKPSLSYADFHHEITKITDPKSSRNQQKQQIGGKAAEDDELVKYMSNLPSYLERGENLQEKALNVGVLDWGRLEKWQYNQKQTSYRAGRDSPSSSNNSSFFSTDGSSTHSSRGHSCSPTRQRMRRPTLESHLKASPEEGSSQGVQTLEGDVKNSENLEAAQSNMLNRKQKSVKVAQSVCKYQSEIKLEQCMRKESDLKIIPEMGTSSNLENFELVSCLKGKMMTQDGEYAKKAEKHKNPNSDTVDLYHPERQETVVLLLPGDIPYNGSSGVSQISGSTTVTGQRSTETRRSSSTEGSYSEDAHHAELSSDIPHSCSQTRGVNNNKHTHMRRHSSVHARSFDFSSDASFPFPHTYKRFISPSKGRNLEEMTSTTLPINPTVIKPSEWSDLRRGTKAAAKARNSSPTRQFSIGMGRMSKISSSKEGSAVPLRSACITAKLGSDKDMASACLEDSSSDKPNATSRSRSSPLRRLLEPLLKPKAANSSRVAESSQKDSTSIDRVCKPSNGQADSSTVHSVKVKLDLKSCRSVSVNDSCVNGKRGSSAVQALVQLAAKNGLPLFTFAVDNSSDILAAIGRKLGTSGKDKCLYTFCTIREMKKKSWINQGGKGKGHDYIPNVVAQMEVSDSPFSSLRRQNSMDQFCMKEFVLFATAPRQADEHKSDSQPNNELAAIVVKIPKETSRSLIQDGHQSDNYYSLPEFGFKDCLPGMRSYSNSVENLQNQTFVGSEDHYSTTVILPSGVHSIPSKGGPSSLIERWISGGACDCGGWDLGCKLRVLDNQNQLSIRPSPSKACSPTHQFELFSQGGDQENRPVFSLAPFKDGIYSVEFSSSLSLLQAFSICIAVISSRKPSELSELSDFLNGKTSEETILVKDDGIKASNGIQQEVPARYVSFPPHSPVGRV